MHNTLIELRVVEGIVHCCLTKYTLKAGFERVIVGCNAVYYRMQRWLPDGSGMSTESSWFPVGRAASR